MQDGNETGASGTEGTRAMNTRFCSAKYRQNLFFMYQFFAFISRCRRVGKFVSAGPFPNG